MAAIGRPNLRKEVFGPLRFDPYDTSRALSDGSMSIGPNLKLCLPKGTDLIRPERSIPRSRMRLRIPPCYAAQNRRISGYVADLLRADRLDAISPLMVTVVFKVPFVYWSTIDRPKSRTYARIIAFSSNAASTVPETLAIGDPITVISARTSSKYKTSHHLGWRRGEIPPLSP